MANTGGTAVRGRWRDVGLVGISFVVVMLGTTLPTPLYPQYAREFGFGELMTTVVFATYAVGVTAGLLLFGHWSDEIGRRPMLLLGVGLSALSAIVFLLPGSLGWLFVGRLLSGVSAGIFTGTATATIIDVAPEGGTARAGLTAAAVNMGGLGLGPLLAGVLTQYAPLPLRLCFVVDLMLTVVAFGCVLAVREPVTPAQKPRLAPRRLQVPADIRAVFVRAAIGGFASFAVLGLFTAVSPAFLGQVLDVHDAAVVGLAVLCLFVGSIVGQTRSDRLGVERALPVGCGVLIAGMALVAAALATESLAVFVGCALVAGFGQGLTFRAGLGSVVSATPAAQRGAVTSTFFVVLYIGIAVPVIGEGALASGVGLVPAGLVFAGVVAALAATALVLVLRSRATPA